MVLMGDDGLMDLMGKVSTQKDTNLESFSKSTVAKAQTSTQRKKQLFDDDARQKNNPIREI